MRYLDTLELESSGYDVIHAYCYNFPVRFLKMGYTVCGGMVWLKGNEPGSVEDGPAVKYVKSILEQCEWSGLDHGTLRLDDNVFNNKTESNYTYNLSGIYPVPIKAPAAKCDDQQVINSKFWSNSLNYTWDRIPNRSFWKNEAWGQSSVTGHKFKFWDVDTAYRGSVVGYRFEDDTAGNYVASTQRCPKMEKSWVAMPHNTITDKKKLKPAEERALRVKQWYEYCRNGEESKL